MTIEPRGAPIADWLQRWERPVDGAGLAVFRILFGLVMAGSAVRFLAKGWVSELYVAPRFHFTYLGFDWVRPWPEPWMSLHLGALALLAVCIALGFWTRAAAGLYCLLFTYAELIEKSAYLNHYYLVSLVAFLLVWLPSDAVWSVRTRQRGPSDAVVLGHYALLRAQIALVYGFAGLAKLNSDWLLRAQPLRIWLQAHADLPGIGGLLGQTWTAYAMSFAGAAFDLSIVALVSSRRTRPVAWVLAVLFHLGIWLLFPIGIFSFVMLAALTCFNEPDWPRRFVSRFGPLPTTFRAPARLGPAWISLAALYLVVQICVPLRFAFYPGRVDWTEQGFRFAWRVMLVEKTGHVEFRVRSGPGAAETVVNPRRELTPLQLEMMSTQPDMIHDYALHLAERFRRERNTPVQVRADAWVAFNGRPSRRLIDPDCDLAAQARTLGHQPWILPLELQRKALSTAADDR